ncbi:recombinase family protein [Oscillatoria laete-virens NRMC-F 0139]|nr:recombinase family protein [Oscillatoria laete-virens]MDL5053324.1 recombinase family protein [Oscillatoria laete-virens NRMC-F 0139]
MKESKPTVRCAIYTRKSTDENLDLEFNSLDAQRESAENFISSQRSEGWVCLSEKYNDGGFTGGNMDRPGLKQLLADVTAGKIDCIVVYKVDRLSRSISDFARIMETFEKHQVSFVSVTQQFNTTTSMGRLMLNVLLSFAQFEREIISERTRDKIAATRRKGKWSGGHPILGYDIDPKGGKLHLNEKEAVRVREIFDLFLKHEALIATIAELDQRGWTTKRWIGRDGKEKGGKPFDKSSLYTLLKNILYIGKVSYKTEVVKGEQPAIVSADTFLKVQMVLQRNGRNGGAIVRNKYGSLLRQVLVCSSCQCSMNHTYSTKDKKCRYRYYVCANAQKRGWNTCSTKSVSAPKIEEYVIAQIKRIIDDGKLIQDTLRKFQAQTQAQSEALRNEERRLINEGMKLQIELRSASGRAKADPARLAELHSRSQETERELSETRTRIDALQPSDGNVSTLTAALRQFDPVWAVLAPRERAKLVELIVERVAYDGANGRIAVTFRPLGLSSLAQRLSSKGA